MSTRGLWLRWSWRDLKSHWVAVVAIALVLAIGTGVYAGLSSTATWRRESNDASFAAVHMHDLRVTLSPGTFIDGGRLEAVVRSVDSAPLVEGVAERLVIDSQLDASTGDETVLVGARLVGMSLDADTIDAVWVRDGTVPGTDVTAPTAVLEAKFADYYDLPTEGSVVVAGGQTVGYVGLGVAPEDFFVVTTEGGVFAEADLATLYMPIATAQDLAGRPDQVNDVVVTLVGGADRELVEAELVTAFDSLEGVGATVTNQDDAEAFRILYEDIDNDQQTWNFISALVLFAAALAAFNLVSRIVEAQRREIGIGMALGARRWRLAIRPLLVGTQIAVVGTLAGIGVGILIGEAMESLLESFLPLPVYRTSFQFGVFGQAAILSLAIPVLAAALPVWRAVRVEPIQAIRTGHLAAKTGRFTNWTAKIRLPGKSVTQMPLRNVLRTPRRTVLTAVGIGAAITALVAILGMLDSFTRTIDQGTDEVTKGDPDRILVQLDTFYPTESDVVASIAVQPTVGGTDAGLRLPAVALTDDPSDEFDVLIELVDLDHAAWVPTVSGAASVDPHDGIVLARKAADDLGVGAGDRVSLRHPVRNENGTFAFVESELVVAGLHPNPVRTFAFADIGQADAFGLGGWVNLVNAYPAADATRADVQRDLLAVPGVASTQAVARVGEVFDEALEQFVGFLIVTAGAVLVLALLIAFNATRITVEERRREHATMRAFGLPVRTVMGVVTKESIVVGIAGTVIGIVGGSVMLSIMLRSITARTLPDFGIEQYVAPSTLVIAVLVGVVAVAVAPLFLVRRIRRMSIPDTLRVME